jgi:hypothetical protein
MESRGTGHARRVLGAGAISLLIAMVMSGGVATGHRSCATSCDTRTAKVGSTIHRLVPVLRHGRTVVFKLTGIPPNEIERVYVRGTHYLRKLSLHRARAAARRGGLRLRLPRGVAKTRGLRLVVVARTAAVRAVAITANPSADAYVNAAKKDSNYGSAGTVWADSSPITRTYLRFDVQGVTAPVSRAVLKLYVRHSSRAALDVRSVSSTSWDEKRITYSNAPAVGTVAASSGPLSAGTWAAVDVTSLVQGSGAVSLALTTSSSNSIGVSSREAGANAPRLSVDPGTALSPPTNIQATAGQTSLSLSWTSSASTSVTGYGLYLDGARIGIASGTGYTFSGLRCGQSYTLAVDAYDSGGNRSEQASRVAATLACPVAGARYAIRGIYDRDIVPQAAIGFNYIDSGAYKDQMDVLAAQGLKGFVWLGGYSNTTCAFNYSDDWVRSHVAAIAGHAGVGAYFIDDEPDAVACPNAPGQIAARSALVRSVDPNPPTFIVTYKVEQFKLFAGTVDVLGLDHYPCSIKSGCDYSKIDAQAAEADRLGVRYWGVIQAHGDAWYKVPTASELHEQFVHWRATNMAGYLVFAWRFPADQPSLWLANNPALLSQLALENSG